MPVVDWAQTPKGAVVGRLDARIMLFTDDGLVNDIQREFWGPDAVKR